MSDRTSMRSPRWTSGILVCMLVVVLWSTNGVAQTPKGVPKKSGATPAATKAAAKTSKLTSTLTGVFTDEQAARGRNFYLGMCKSCHAPESHTGATFNKYWRGKKLADLFTFISTQMPKNDPGSLDPDDIADVMAYILKLNAEPTGKDELYGDADSLKKFRIDVKPLKATTKGTITAKGKKP
ncbi:MAG: c-type cytochrome [Gemmatimonadaceae bacterium]